MKARYVAQHLSDADNSQWGRIIVFTGARQTGKTTLVRNHYADFPYVSVEDPVMRTQYARLTSAQWHAMFPKAILDEVQKEPVLIESVKSVYDQWPDARYILLGSSQLLLLDKIHESLSGRCLIKELFPLSVPELATNDWSDTVPDSPFQQMLLSGKVPVFLPTFLFHPRHDVISEAWRHYVTYGGYPALTEMSVSETDRRSWLATYVRTYLERDVRDLVAFRDLEPYIKLQQYLAFQTSGIVNATNIANDIGVSAKTVMRYLNYLQISYQALLLPAWIKNPAKRLVKSPKMHYLDNGVLQAVLHKQSPMPSGGEFESLVVAELYKQAKQCGADAQFFHLRTSDGKEVDLLIETPSGYFAFEIKKTEHAVREDARHLLSLAPILDKPLVASFVISQDYETHDFDNDVYGVCAEMLVGA